MTRLVLLGGGHAHVQVLAALAAEAWKGPPVTLVSPAPRQLYSGMLPGWVAGHYPIDACAIALDRLADRAGARLVLDTCIGIDRGRRLVRLASGDAFEFDLLSIDTGSLGDAGELTGAAENALPIRPLEGFVAAWPLLLERIRAARDGLPLVVIGAGAAGVEMALAVAARCRREALAPARITLVDPASGPLAGFPESARLHAQRMIGRKGIAWCGGARAVAVEADRVVLDDGRFLPASCTLLTTGARAPAWPAEAGLATDSAGFIAVDRQLRSVSDPCIFAAGDIAAYANGRPKSGVYAVRAGPLLAANLRAAAGDVPLGNWTPQRRALYLISDGEGRALALWGPFAAEGRWAWRWKDRIDRDFIARFA